jgi:hypothetical protein
MSNPAFARSRAWTCAAYTQSAIEDCYGVH